MEECSLLRNASFSTIINKSKPANRKEIIHMREFYVYILTNKKHTVLYTGVTGNLYERV